jgi:hypothetical protein
LKLQDVNNLGFFQINRSAEDGTQIFMIFRISHDFFWFPGADCSMLFGVVNAKNHNHPDNLRSIAMV